MSAPAAGAARVSPSRGGVRAMSDFDVGAHYGSERYVGSAQGMSVVELRVAARARMVATVRAVAAHVAGRADFDIDTISDLRLAVDEACGSLVELTSGSGTLECVFDVSEDAMNVLVGTVVEAPASLDTTGFGWQLLRALTDWVELESGVAGRPGWIGIRFGIGSARGSGRCGS